MKTVIFDVGGVLVDFHADQMFQSICSGCRPGTEENEIRQLLNELNLSLGERTFDDFRSSLTANLGYGGSRDELLHHWNVSLTKRDWVAGQIDSLRSQAHLHILSDTNQEHWSYIKQNLLDLSAFENVFLSFELSMRKDGKAVFKHVLGVIGEAPEDCLFIDDTLSNVEIARSCSLKAHHYLNRNGMFEAIDSHLSE